MKIALTYTGCDQKHNNYMQWLQAHTDVEVLKISAVDHNLNEMINCDALVLAGGRDIHPKLYKNQNTDYNNSPISFDEERDGFEIAAFNLAQQQSLPVLAICRGMQLVNCILGGTLKQDLGEALNKIHRAQPDQDKLHDVNVVPHTIIDEITKGDRCSVNSAHHQAIEKLGTGLKVNCAAHDGIIEGLEWAEPSGKPFLLCVQWHPERMFKFQLEDAGLSKNIRNKFIEEIKNLNAAK